MLKSTKIKLLVLLFISTTIFVPPVSKAQTNPNAEIENIVHASFVDMPDMIAIAKCESGFRQFGPDGNPLRGGSGKAYIGIFQIGERLHRQKALDMAFDINTIEGNIAYARYMFFASGTNPWKGCLIGPAAPAPIPVIQIPNPIPTPTPVSAATTTISGLLSANLNFGMTNAQILILQKILNKNGFVISASGPGSPGNETNYFGGLTREAVRKFQCANQIVCSGTESSTGYGRVGPITRVALNKVQ